MDEPNIDIGSAGPLAEAPPVETAERSHPVTAGGDKGEKPVKLSLRDQLKANFEEAKKEPSPARQAAVQDRARDEKGRLLPKDAVEAPKEAAPAKETPSKEAQPIAASKSADGPPPGWSQASKQAFASLPDHLKSDVLKREKEVSDGFKQYSSDAKKYQEFESRILSQLRPLYQSKGVHDDAEALSRLGQWAIAFERNPEQALLNYGLQNRIDFNRLASLAQGNSGQSNGPDAALQQYLNPVYQTVNSVKSELDQIRNERAANEIAVFSKDKPYFDKVKVAMGKLLASGSASDLESAYQTAIWSDSEIRAEMMQKEVESKLEATRAQASQRSQDARKAAVSPSTRAPAPPPLGSKDKPKGVRGSIMAAVEEIRESTRA